MARKLNKNLLALGTAAVAVVYGVGYAHTQSAADSLAAGVGASAPATASTNASAATVNSRTAPSAATAIAHAVAQATATPTNGSTATGYRDVVYTGSGSNRFGEIDVAVTVQSGQITDVKITRATTHYPVSRIASLPGQVTSQQSDQIQLVSGATYSSLAFRDAVSQALAQAQTGTAASSSATTAGS